MTPEQILRSAPLVPSKEVELEAGSDSFLVEASVMGVMSSPVSRRAGMLIDLRPALPHPQARPANCLLLVGFDATEIHEEHFGLQLLVEPVTDVVVGEETIEIGGVGCLVRIMAGRFLIVWMQDSSLGPTQPDLNDPAWDGTGMPTWSSQVVVAAVDTLVAKPEPS